MKESMEPDRTPEWWNARRPMVRMPERWASARITAVDVPGNRVLARLSAEQEAWLDSTSCRLTWEGRVPQPKGGRHASGCWRCRSTAPALFDLRCPLCGTAICQECGACGKRCSGGRYL